jgi:branched-chain amino acid transport system ATP-binding protein
MTALLELENIEAGYGLFQVLQGVNLRVGGGELVAVVGSNGSGKTTMLRCVSGLLKPTKGRILFEGRAINGESPSDIVKAGLIQIPEGRQLFPELTVEDTLLVGASIPRTRPHRSKNLDRVYHLFPRLKTRRKQYCGTLSGGEQQMVAIGRGLMSMPRLLMLDEPSLGLSPLIVRQLFPIISEINRDGCTVLLIEQNVTNALRISGRAYVLEHGVMQLDGSSEELMNDPRVADSYFGLGSKESL